jgi:hypothetical protein
MSQRSHSLLISLAAQKRKQALALSLTHPQQSARLFSPVPLSWLVWSFGVRRDGPAGSEAASGDLGCRRGRLSALMQRAEEATYAEFERLKREIIEPSLCRHDGRLIKTTGDGALAEFASPSAAARCAKPVWSAQYLEMRGVVIGRTAGDSDAVHRNQLFHERRRPRRGGDQNAWHVA